MAGGLGRSSIDGDGATPPWLPGRRRPAHPGRSGERTPMRRDARARRCDETLDVGRRGLARPRRDRVDGTRGHRSGGTRSATCYSHSALATAWRRALQPRHTPSTRPRHVAGYLVSPARRRPSDAHPVAPRRALGARALGWHRRTASPLTPAAGRPRRRAPTLRHHGPRKADACRLAEPSRERRLGPPRFTASRVAPPPPRRY